MQKNKCVKNIKAHCEKNLLKIATSKTVTEIFTGRDSMDMFEEKTEING